MHFGLIQTRNCVTNQILDNGNSSRYFCVRLPKIEQRCGFLKTGSIRHLPNRQHSQWACSTGTVCCCVAQWTQSLADAGAQVQSHSSHSRRPNCPISRQNHRVDAVDQRLEPAMMTVQSLDTEWQQSEHLSIQLLTHCAMYLAVMSVAK